MKKMLLPILLCSIIASPVYGGRHDRYHDRGCSSFEKFGALMLATGVVAGVLYGLYHLFHETADQAYSRCKSFLFKMHDYSDLSHRSHRDLMYELYSHSSRRYPVLTYKDNLDSTISQAQRNLRTIRSWITELKKEYRELGSRHYFLIQEFEILEQDYLDLLPDLKSLSGRIGSLPQYADERKEQRKDERQKEKLLWQQPTYHCPHPREDAHLHVHL